MEDHGEEPTVPVPGDAAAVGGQAILLEVQSLRHTLTGRILPPVEEDGHGQGGS